MSAALTFERVTRRFGARVALLDVNLVLEPGLIGLLGPNGAGKTTFLRLAAGLYRPSSGRIAWFEGHPRRHPALDNRIAMSTDGDALPVRESPLEWLTMLLACSGFRRADAVERAAATLHRLGLAEKLDSPISQLSRGQRQRVKLAQAFALPADLLLLDEPMTALDPIWRMNVAAMVRQAAEDGACVVISSHILEEVEELASRLVLLFKGRVVAAGSQQEIRDLLRNRGTALRIHCDAPRRLGRELLDRADIQILRLEPDNLEVVATDLGAVGVALPPAVLAAATRVRSVGSDGDDLVSLFKNLSQEVR